MDDQLTFQDACKRYLDTRWENVLALASEDKLTDVLGPEHNDLKKRIARSLSGPIKTYHYVLPTQTLCKVVAPDLNAHSLQKAWGVSGAFDARTIAHGVIVPFDKANHNVLGGSSEPYVNNPVRCLAVIPEFRGSQKRAGDWDDLVQVLDVIEEATDPTFVARVFDQVLIEIYRLLQHVAVRYPVPNRVSLEATQTILERFLATKSGGDRVEAVATALFRTVGSEFGLFDRVDREKVNAADVSSGRFADIECWSQDRIVLLVEVKDRTLTLTHADSKLERARVEQITELLFLAERGPEPNDAANIKARIEAEFRSGQNVYVTSLWPFAMGVLILLREDGRQRFLRAIGEEMDQAGSDIGHRRAWAMLLKRV